MSGAGRSELAPAVPVRRARRPRARQSLVLLRLEDASEHGLGFLSIEVWRRSRPGERGGAPGVHRDSESGEEPEERVERTAGDGEEHDQIGRVVEREAEAELLPSVVLIEKRWNRYRSRGDPERRPQPWTLPRKEEQGEERRGGEEAHSVRVVIDPEWMELHPLQQEECGAQVSRQVGGAEQAVRADVWVDTVRVEMGVAELERIAESRFVHPRNGNGDRHHRGSEQCEPLEHLVSTARIPECQAQISAVERSAVAEDFEQEEDAREKDGRSRDGAAGERRAGPEWMPRSKRGVQVQQRQRDSDDFRCEPDLAADRAGPGERSEPEEQREDGIVPLGSRSAFHPLDASQQQVEESDIRRREGQRESDVVEGEPREGDERQHEESRERRERYVPAASLEDPVVQVGRVGRQIESAVEKSIGLPDEVRRLRLVAEEAPAGKGVREQRETEEKQV